MGAVADYQRLTGQRVFVEYVMLAGEGTVLVINACVQTDGFTVWVQTDACGVGALCVL
jgi:hypothetical protein